MAKTKISELAEQLGADRKDIVSFLNEKGIAAKTGNSSIEDDAVAMVAGHFKENKAANTKTEKAVTVDKTPEEKTIVKKHVRIETVKPETAATAPDAHETSAAAANSASAAGVIPVKKKKKIIIVTGGNAGGQNRQQSQTNVRQPGQSQGQRSNVAASRQSEKRQNGNTFTGRPVHKIIKPKTVPSQMEVDYHKPMQPSQMAKQVNRQEKPEPVVEEPKKTVAATQVTEKVSVPSESTVKPAENKSVGKAPEAAPVKTAQENATVNIGSEKTEKKETVEKPAEKPVEKPAAKTENTGNRSAAGNGQSSHGVYISRGGQSGQGGYNGNRGGQGSYNNNRSGQGSYGNRGGQGGQNSQGSYGNRGGYSGGQGGQNSQGSYGNRGGYQGGQGGQNSQGSYGNRGGYQGGQGGQNSQGSYGNRGGYQGGQGGQNSQGGYGNRGGYSGGQGGQNSQGGYGNRGGYSGGQGGYGNRGGYSGGQGARPGQGYGGNRGGYSGGQGGYGGNRGGYSGGQGGYGGNRGGYSGGQGQGGYGNRRPGTGRPGQNNTNGDTFVKDAEKHRDENKRKQGQERDKRNRKDYMFNDGAANALRPGRFIRPEKKEEEVVEEQIKTISVPDKITIRDLADKMHLRDADIIKNLFLKGQVTTPNTELTYDDVEKLAIDYDILCEKEEPVDIIQEMLKEDDDNEDTLVARPPVICVMGHVDHGKTSLLDYIRKAHVTQREAGGITQAIGAYTVDIKDRKITFLDTPGHEAFTAMRMRGANSTDIAVLVVAADDGVMPQTVEAINHAKAAGIEIIVAVNKIDKPNANIDMVKQELTKYDLVATDWGGTTEFVPVSAKTGQGVDDLLDTILLTSDILELKANPDRKARGLVLEAKLDKGRGPVANVLVQKGTLHVGDFISAGAASGKVRAMINDRGDSVDSAGPSIPVEVLGLSEVPSAGEVLVAHDSDKEAKQFATTYRNQHKENLLEETRMKMSLDDLFMQMKEGNLKEFDVIIKADVQGSVEALKASLMKLSNDEVVVKCIHGGVGAINESDVTLASASNAVIIGFNVRPDPMAEGMAEREGVDVRLYKVIYEAIDAVAAALKGMEAPVYEEQVTGHAEIRQIFKASQVGNIAGSSVLDGAIRRGCKVRVTRGKDKVFEGDLASLKRFKDDAKEVKEGFECGLVFDGFDNIQVGDLVEAYEMVQVTGDKATAIKAERAAKRKADAAAAAAALEAKDKDKA